MAIRSRLISTGPRLESTPPRHEHERSRTSHPNIKAISVAAAPRNHRTTKNARRQKKWTTVRQKNRESPKSAQPAARECEYPWPAVPLFRHSRLARVAARNPIAPRRCLLLSAARALHSPREARGHARTKRPGSLSKPKLSRFRNSIPPKAPTPQLFGAPALTQLVIVVCSLGVIELVPVRCVLIGWHPVTPPKLLALSA